MTIEEVAEKYKRMANVHYKVSEQMKSDIAKQNEKLCGKECENISNWLFELIELREQIQPEV